MNKRQITDNSAPRCRKDSTIVFNAKFIKKFFKDHPEFGFFAQEHDLRDLQGFIKTFNENIAKSTIQNRRSGVLFPLQMGWLYLASSRPKFNRVNDKVSNELGRDVRFTNNHTDGKTVKIVYRSAPKRFNFENKGMWDFVPAQKFCKEVSADFTKNYAQYFTTENHDDIRKRKLDFYRREGLSDKEIRKLMKR